MQQSIKISIENIDATKVKADVLALKYAQARYGLDAFVYDKLLKAGLKREEMSPKPGNFSKLHSAYGIAANEVLFIGTVPLRDLGYREIRNLGRTTLTTLAKISPNTQHVIVTVHGVRCGLDESESFESQIAGFVDAIKSGEIPERLKIIIFAEKNLGRAQRLRNLLEQLIADGLIEFDTKWNIKNVTPDATEKLRSVGYASNSKKHIFVAMPFCADMEDLFKIKRI